MEGSRDATYVEIAPFFHYLLDRCLMAWHNYRFRPFLHAVVTNQPGVSDVCTQGPGQAQPAGHQKGDYRHLCPLAVYCNVMADEDGEAVVFLQFHGKGRQFPLRLDGLLDMEHLIRVLFLVLFDERMEVGAKGPGGRLGSGTIRFSHFNIPLSR